MTKPTSFAVVAFLINLFWSSAQLTVLSEDFNAGIGTFTAIDVSDAANVWTANAGVMEMNGYGGADDEDWLISPAVDMDAQLDEYLIFDYNDGFAGAFIELYYSTDYNGGGTVVDLQNANWTNMPLTLLDMNATSCFSTLFQPHRAIDVSGINGTSVYFAIKYTGTSTASKDYSIDNFRILAEYYNDVHTFLAGGGSCEALMNEVNTVIGHNQSVVYYTSTNYDLWDALLVTDRRMNDAGTAEIVWDMFTDIPSGTGEFEFDHCNNRDNGSCPGGEGQCYNREHSFPRSWWGGTTSYPADTFNFDLHHIVPSDRTMNVYKLNYPPGVVTTTSSSGSNGFKVGYNPSYPCSSMMYFEPIDEYKGDYARMYLYFITRYKSHIAGMFGNSTQGDCALTGASYPGLAPWLMDVLLTWHANDPVSQKEIDRNNQIYAIQGNRNPYIDNPQWVGYIWGDTQGNSCSDLASTCVPTSGSESVTTCNTYTWAANGMTYSASGSYTATVVNAGGCDSTATLNLTVNAPAVPIVTVQNNCGSTTLTATGTNLMWSTGETTPSITVTSSGNYTVNQTASGCTSTDATAIASPLQPSTSTTTLTACDNYLWTDGNTYASSGSYTQTLTNAVGCDSIATLDLTITNSSTGSEVVSACDSFTWPTNGTTYTTTGTYTATLVNAAGCDSIVTLDLTVNTASAPIVTVQNNCGSSVLTATGSNLVWSTAETTPSITVTTGGTYTVNQTSNGCTSSNTTVAAAPLQSSTSTTSVTYCDNYIWTDGNTYTASGTYTQTLTNAAGCDSIATLDLTITTYSASTDVVAACDSYTWIDGNTYTANNNAATVTLTGANGCDSIVTLNLTITNSTNGTDVITACNNYTWMDGNTYSSSNNTATWVLTNAAGCDSVVTLDLTIDPSTSSVLTETALDSYTLNGQVYTQSGTYTQTISNSAGCDSTITLNLTVEHTGLIENEMNISVYPNPVNETLNIQSDVALEGKYQILDAQGRLIQLGELGVSVMINVSEISKGVYYLTFENYSMRIRFIKD